MLLTNLIFTVVLNGRHCCHPPFTDEGTQQWKLSGLLKVTQQVQGWTGTWIRTSWYQGPPHFSAGNPLWNLSVSHWVPEIITVRWREMQQNVFLGCGRTACRETLAKGEIGPAGPWCWPPGLRIRGDGNQMCEQQLPWLPGPRCALW